VVVLRQQCEARWAEYSELETGQLPESEMAMGEGSMELALE
jgi:hypothetical protein